MELFWTRELGLVCLVVRRNSFLCPPLFPHYVVLLLLSLQHTDVQINCSIATANPAPQLFVLQPPQRKSPPPQNLAQSFQSLSPHPTSSLRRCSFSAPVYDSWPCSRNYTRINPSNLFYPNMSAQDYYGGGGGGGGYPQHPQPSYGPPQGQYGPPQGNYGPPQGQYYGPPQGQPPMQYQQAPPPQQSGGKGGGNCLTACLAALCCCCVCEETCECCFECCDCLC